MAENKEPLKIKVFPSESDSNVVKLRKSAMTRLKQKQREVGLSLSAIVSEMIMHYIDEVELEEV